MSYYVIGDGEIIGISDGPRYTEADLAELADVYDVSSVWVIDGEHAGITYERESEQSKPAPKPRLVFGEPIPDELIPDKPKQAPFSLWRTV